MRLIYFLFFILLIFYSCGNNNKIYVDEGGVIVVPVNMDGIPFIDQLVNMSENSLLSSVNSVDITQLVDSVSFVKLETDRECLIGRIKKVFFVENRFFIHEVKTSTILVFDQSGKFLHKIGRRGNGPGEYVNISCFMLDETNKMVLLFDEVSKKMIYYSLEGKFIREIHKFSDGAIIRDIYNLPDGRFICYTQDYMKKSPWGVWEVDSEGKPGKFYIKQDTKYPVVFSSEHYFYKLPNGQVGLGCADVNYIYHFSDTTANKYISLKPNKKTLEDFPNEDYNSSMISKIKVREKGNYMIIEWVGNEGQFCCTTIYFKDENKLITTLGIRYDPNNIGAIVGCDVDFNINDQMINVIYAQDVDHLIESKYVSTESKNMLSSFFSEEDDNPVLEILYLK